MDKIPRSQRYRYGRHLEDALYALPLLAIQAATAGTKTKVYAFSDHIECLNSLIRIGAERRLLSARWVGHIMAPPAPDAEYGGTMRQIIGLAVSMKRAAKAKE